MKLWTKDFKSQLFIPFISTLQHNRFAITTSKYIASGVSIIQLNTSPINTRSRVVIYSAAS